MKKLTDDDIQRLAERHGIDVKMIKAIYRVESKGDGFLADGKVKILFERHIFHRELNKLKFKTLANQMMKIRPDLCHSKPTQKGGYGKVSEQHQRLQDAIALVLKVRPNADESLQNVIKECALKACSWGLGQIMGFNHAMVGFDNIHDFVQAMERDEASQLEAMINYLHHAGLSRAIQNKDFAKIAQAYNGVNYAKFDYHNKLAQAYQNA